METDFKKPFFSRAILGALFAGFLITIADLAYNVIYREAEGFSKALPINVSSIIFGIMGLSLVIGLIFYLFARYVKKGRLMFALFMLVATAFFASLVIRFQWQHGIPRGIDGLACGLILITGLAASLLVPYFVRHSDLIV